MQKASDTTLYLDILVLFRTFRLAWLLPLSCLTCCLCSRVACPSYPGSPGFVAHQEILFLASSTAHYSGLFSYGEALWQSCLELVHVASSSQAALYSVSWYLYDSALLLWNACADFTSSCLVVLSGASLPPCLSISGRLS